MIIGISAPIGCGKDTFYNLFQKHSNVNWENKKFAYKLKQIVALLTGCRVEDLESEEFKNWELPDIWDKEVCRSFHGESQICSTKKYTYREVLQLFGTELMRNGFHPQVHINALFADYKDETPSFNFFNGKQIGGMPNWLITDLRFKNEFQAIKERNGITIRVERYMEPENWLKSKYFNQIKFDKQGCDIIEVPGIQKMSKTDFVSFLQKNSFLLKNKNDSNFLKLIHQSETDLNDHYRSGEFDHVVKNDSTLEDFENKVIELIKEIGYAK